MQNDEEIFSKILQVLVQKVADVLKTIGTLNFNGLYISQVANAVSGGVLHGLESKFPKLAEILKLLLAYVQKQSITHQSTDAAKNLAEVEREIAKLSERFPPPPARSP